MVETRNASGTGASNSALAEPVVRASHSASARTSGARTGAEPAGSSASKTPTATATAPPHRASATITLRATRSAVPGSQPATRAQRKTRSYTSRGATTSDSINDRPVLGNRGSPEDLAEEAQPVASQYEVAVHR